MDFPWAVKDVEEDRPIPVYCKCHDCDVTWREQIEGEGCWVCGNPGERLMPRNHWTKSTPRPE